MGSLSEWLKIMLDEVARKRDDAVRAAAEVQQRQAGNLAVDAPPGKKLKGASA